MSAARRATPLALALLLGAASGCAPTGVLELQLMLPARTADEPAFALVQVRRPSSHPFALDWQPQDDAPAFELGPEPVLAQISVIGQEPEDGLHIKVRFCHSPRCEGLDDSVAPELWFELERPFYEGRRTAWGACLAALPDARPETATRIGRCQIHGCTVGSATHYCEGGDQGPHFCELGGVDEAPRDLRCIGSEPAY